MIKKTIAVLSGVAGSGKTTFIKNYLNDYTVVGFDITMEREFNTDLENPLTYDEMNKKWRDLDEDGKQKFKQKGLDVLADAIEHHQDIAIDRVNGSNEERIKWLKDIDRDKYWTVLVLFDVNEKHLMRVRDKREKEEGKTLPKKVIGEMIEAHEEDVSPIVHYFDKIMNYNY